MNSIKELIAYYSVSLFGLLIRALPLGAALFVGRFIGILAYYLDAKHKSQAYANLKMAFADKRSPDELKKVTKDLFMNYGRNFIELLRMPLLSQEQFRRYVDIEGQENIEAGLKQGKGVILLAMHFGSWEMASLSCAMLGFPYKVIVKPQKKYSKLDELLNSYRTCSGSVVLSRGMDTRDFLKSLKNNEVIGMVVDQGGRDGVLVPFFGRQASMSSGAIRMGLKWGVPICFAVIYRKKGAYHKMVIHPPFELTKAEEQEKAIKDNLSMVVKTMEQYIQRYPAEYMWTYKIWKYSNEAKITILNDGKTGHLRQSQIVAELTRNALSSRGISASIQTVRVEFKRKFYSSLFTIISYCSAPFIHQGRLGFLKFFLTEDSFSEVMSNKADFIISCGSSVAGVNHLLSQDHNAKSIAILRPGILSLKRFDLVVLPQHDIKQGMDSWPNVIVTQGAPNLINEAYLNQQKEKLLSRYSHLKSGTRQRVGLLIGGDAKAVSISEYQIKIMVHQLKELSRELNFEIIGTTSRRTPARVDQLLINELKRDAHCPLMIIENHEHVDEAIGGILGIADVLIVSGDSISMISEAACAGKKTIVFSPEVKGIVERNKHMKFIKLLAEQGYIISTDVKHIKDTTYSVLKNKLSTRKLQDQENLAEAIRNVI